MLGFVIAFVATVSSSVVAYNATELQASSARQQSADEFRRGERKDAYSAFLTAVQHLDDVEGDFRPRNFRYPLDTGTGEVRQNSDKWLAANTEFMRAVAGVQLAGSPRVKDALLSVMEVHSAVMQSYLTAVTQIGTNDQPGAAKSIEQFEARRRDATKPEGDFIAAAKADLGL